jgi:hypothetical protein
MQYKGLALGFTFAALVLFVNAPALAADTHQGKVVEASAGKLVMTDMEGKNQHTMEIPSDATILCEGKTCGLTDVKAGDVVTVTTDKKGDKTQVTKVEAKKAGS